MRLTDEDEDAIRILLERYQERLSEWEVQFLESLGNQDGASEKQKAKLDEIWERVTA